MSVAVKTIPNRRATRAIGSCSGSVTYQSFLIPVAPSTFAASSTSAGIEASPAMKITVAKGRIRQAWTMISDAIARFGRPSHCGGSIGSITWSPRWSNTPVCRWTSVQFETESVASKIQSQPIVPSATGAAQGSTTRKRRNQRPRNGFTRRWARIAAPTRTIACETSVKKIVFRNALRKFSLCQTSV